jgi:hypothetical protein
MLNKPNGLQSNFDCHTRIFEMPEENRITATTFGYDIRFVLNYSLFCTAIFCGYKR